MNFITNWIAKFSETMIENDRYLMIFEGLGNTVKITLGALCIGVLIGLIIAVVKYLAEDSKMLRPLAKLCDLLTNFVSI